MESIQTFFKQLLPCRSSKKVLNRRLDSLEINDERVHIETKIEVFSFRKPRFSFQCEDGRCDFFHHQHSYSTLQMKNVFRNNRPLLNNNTIFKEPLSYMQIIFDSGKTVEKAFIINNMLCISMISYCIIFYLISFYIK